jgi:hypothetical protein
MLMRGAELDVNSVDAELDASEGLERSGSLVIDSGVPPKIDVEGNNTLVSGDVFQVVTGLHRLRVDVPVHNSDEDVLSAGARHDGKTTREVRVHCIG